MSTDDSQNPGTFVKAVNQALCTELHCLVYDASFGKLNFAHIYINTQ